MKKIIATVLAMVMALALCSTAFAVSYSDGYYFDGGKWNKIDLTKVTVSYTNPSETKTDGKVTSAKIGYFTLTNTDNTKVVLVEVAQDDATYQIKADSTVKYLKKSNGNHDKPYTLTGTALTSSTDCGKAEFLGTTKALFEADGKYYVEGGSTYMLADDGQVYAVTAATAGVNYRVNGHNFKVLTSAIDAKGVLTGTAKCEKCTQTATLTNKKSAIPVGAKSQEITVAGYDTTTYGKAYVFWTEAAASTGTTTTTSSPKTFDAGIAMYVGMALTSVAGSAVVIGKKKEF